MNAAISRESIGPKCIPTPARRSWVCLPLLMLLCAVGFRPTAVHAQETKKPYWWLEMDQPRMLSKYLFNRWKVTRNTPVVVLCGAAMSGALTTESRQTILHNPDKLADSVVVWDKCEENVFAKGFSPQSDVVFVNEIVIGKAISYIDAWTRPHASADGSGFRTYHERFMVDQSRNPSLGEESLIFSGFNVPVD
ncbi:MAG: hypothetical protein ABJC19_05395 [Gemmatimonadota bacterium]